jgi:hypothetical protein
MEIDPDTWDKFFDRIDSYSHSWKIFPYLIETKRANGLIATLSLEIIIYLAVLGILLWVAYQLLIKYGYTSEKHIFLFYIFAILVVLFRLTNFSVMLSYFGSNKNQQIGGYPEACIYTCQMICIYFKMMLGLT